MAAPTTPPAPPAPPTWTPDPSQTYSTLGFMAEDGTQRFYTEAEAATLFPAPTLAQVQAAKVAAVQAQFATLLAAGLSYQGQHVAIDDGSRANLTACAVEAVLCAQGASTWPANYAKGWITLEGGRIALPAYTDGLALAQAAGNYYAALAQHGQDLENAVTAATTLAAAQAVDPTAGWPVNTSTAPTS